MPSAEAVEEVAEIEVTAGQEDHADQEVAEDEVANLPHPVIRGPSIQTCQLGTGLGAPTISNSDEEHTFVQNLRLAHGRIFTPNDLKNEKLTSSVKNQSRHL